MPKEPSAKEMRRKRMKEQLTDEVLARYVRKRILPRLDEPDQQFECALLAEGPRSLKFRLTLSSGRSFVLKWCSRKKIRKSTAAYRILAANGVSVPALRHVDCSWWTGYRTGFAVSCHDFVEGAILRAAGPFEDYRDTLAQLVAGMHNAQSQRWGVPGDPGSGDYIEHHLNRAQSFLTKALELGASISDAEAREIADWCRARAAELDVGPPFSLIHTDLHDGNLMLANDGTLFLIDHHTVQYGRWPYDLVKILLNFCKNDEARWEPFLAPYFAATTFPCASDWRREFEFYLVCYMVRRTYSRAKSLKLSPDAQFGHPPEITLDDILKVVRRSTHS